MGAEKMENDDFKKVVHTNSQSYFIKGNRNGTECMEKLSGFL